MSVVVCTDSSALLPAPLAAGLGVLVAPARLTLDGRSFEEGVDIDVDDFYERLSGGAEATTSQPSPGCFSLLYRAAADAGATEVLSLHLDARVSGTVSSAALAAREAGVPVTVVDCGTVSFGVAVSVMTAVESLGAGLGAAEAVARALRVARGIGNVFIASGTTGGRVPGKAGLPLLSFADGAARPVGSACDLPDAAAAMARHLSAQGDGLRVAVGHAAASTAAAADALADGLGRSGTVSEVIRYRIGPSIGAHTGPQCFGAFWWRPAT